MPYINYLCCRQRCRSQLPIYFDKIKSNRISSRKGAEKGLEINQPKHNTDTRTHSHGHLKYLNSPSFAAAELLFIDDFHDYYFCYCSYFYYFCYYYSITIEPFQCSPLPSFQDTQSHALTLRHSVCVRSSSAAMHTHTHSQCNQTAPDCSFHNNGRRRRRWQRRQRQRSNSAT